MNPGNFDMVSYEHPEKVRKGSIGDRPVLTTPQEGKVVAVGTGKIDDDGKKIPFNVKKGDLVLMPKYGGTEVKIGGKEYQIVREEDILGIIG